MEGGDYAMSKNNLVVNREKLETEMSRVFDAPRELVWKVNVDPKLIPQWWGPKNTVTIVEEMDVRPGGKWRYVHEGENGEKYAFYGEYKDLKEPEFITWTFNFEPIGPGHEITETVRFEVLADGKTRVHTTSHYKSIEDLDGMVQSGMEGGATETWDRLEELVGSMK